MKPLAEISWRPATGFLAISENDDDSRLQTVFKRNSCLVHCRCEGRAPARYQRIDLPHDALCSAYRRTEIELNVALIVCPGTVSYQTDSAMSGDMGKG